MCVYSIFFSVLSIAHMRRRNEPNRVTYGVKIEFIANVERLSGIQRVRKQNS